MDVYMNSYEILKNSHLLQKALKEFFNPIKPKDIRIPKNNQKKSIGVYIYSFYTMQSGVN